MYIYTMCFNPTNGAIRVKRNEVVKETDTAYKMVDGSIINKKILNVINTEYIGYGYRMLTLEPDIAYYKAKVRGIIMKQYEHALKVAGDIKNTTILLETIDKVQYLY